ncbi:ABC transporter ATP-binding protein [Candidatus Oleimmundimicrobium sp.]|uniref:ABC transporter ATP-binding protein n=1 Tax=Candidatus Oleimmundimicrobium sp. TaxID=3060597 RepID=UPI00271E2755|nr:ABC transporter ATP-binding protein [Candidatus Oleimmundimicrobium sp.]MDO8886879.1 ABC transporter ATP-binding protein [Candidatus Oleimmundimicrobium sp.]
MLKSSPFICINSLSKDFGRRKVLKELNLDVCKGDFLAIFGSNGAGKTTLLRILATLSGFSSGSITINGFEIKENSIEIREKIGLISHNLILYKDLNAYENLRFYGKMYNVPALDDRISELLQKVELDHRKFDVVRTFSRGMQQRLSIARALLHNPEIIFLDEPFSGLDVHARGILDDMLEGLKKEGSHTLIMATHDIEKGLVHANSLAILSGGKIVYSQRGNLPDLDSFKRIYHEHAGDKI